MISSVFEVRFMFLSSEMISRKSSIWYILKAVPSSLTCISKTWELLKVKLWAPPQICKKFWEWVPAICMLSSLSSDSDVCWHWKLILSPIAICHYGGTICSRSCWCPPYRAAWPASALILWLLSVIKLRVYPHELFQGPSSDWQNEERWLENHPPPTSTPSHVEVTSVIFHETAPCFLLLCGYCDDLGRFTKTKSYSLNPQCKE